METGCNPEGVKLSHRRHEGMWGKGYIAVLIFNLGTGWKWAVNFISRTLYPREKSPCYLINRKLGEFHRRSISLEILHRTPRLSSR